MKRVLVLSAVVLLSMGCATFDKGDGGGEWISLFNGENLDGWKINENPQTWKAEDGAIIANGPRSHLFYMGPVENHNFKNFEFKADVMTTPGSNSGIYIHTKYQEKGWPTNGYEVQINNSQPTEPRKTGGLYAVADVYKPPAGDNVWFTMNIIVRDNHIVTKVNGETLIDYVEPSNAARSEEWKDRRLSSGTFALQGHDPGSKVYFRNIMVRPDRKSVV